MHIRHLGLRPYLETWDAMRTYTAVRDRDSADELWLVQHPPVFTQGQAGKTEHLLAPGDIPVIHIDRGGKLPTTAPDKSSCTCCSTSAVAILVSVPWSA